jgi:hypothetical protein
LVVFGSAPDSKDGVKACYLSVAVLKRMEAMEHRRSSSSRSCGPGLVDERMDTEDTRPRRLSRALNPESQWVLAHVVAYIFFNPRR